MKKQKIKAMSMKCQRARGRICLFSEEEKNYKSDTGDKTDPDEADNNKNPLQL